MRDCCKCSATRRSATAMVAIPSNPPLRPPQYPDLGSAYRPLGTLTTPLMPARAKGARRLCTSFASR